MPYNARDLPSTLFWPAKLVQSGYIYGWMNDEGSACAVGVLEVKGLQAAKDTLKTTSEEIGEVLKHTGDIRILGYCTAGIDEVKGKEAVKQPWIHMNIHNGVPRTEGATALILYSPPNPRQLRFLSVSPLQMDITAYRVAEGSTRSRKSDPLTSIARASFQADFTRIEAEQADLELAVLQINSAHEVRQAVEGKAACATLRSADAPPKEKSSLSGLFRRALLLLVMVLNTRLFGKNAMKDVSATAHQLDVRLRQALAGPAQFQASYRPDRAKPGIRRAHYISFYSTLWLVANDVIIGSALLTFLCENSEYLAGHLGFLLKEYGIRGLQETLLWLNDWPGGLKLNYELGKFFCDAFLWFTTVWEEVFLEGILIPNLSSIISALGISAAGGSTIALSLASDLLTLATWHLYAFYVMATAVFSFHTRAMASLFNIFRGKKYNTLRQRTEPSEYQLDQLLVGAILFTLAAFLFPTVLAYYLVFALSRLCIILIHACLEAVLAFLNHFPLFAVMLRFKDPERLPGGLQFRLLQRDGEPALEMKYWAIWSSFSQHYSPIYLGGKVLSGRYINAIPRSRLTFLERATTRVQTQ